MITSKRSMNNLIYLHLFFLLYPWLLFSLRNISIYWQIKVMHFWMKWSSLIFFRTHWWITSKRDVNNLICMHFVFVMYPWIVPFRMVPVTAEFKNSKGDRYFLHSLLPDPSKLFLMLFLTCYQALIFIQKL